MLFHSLEGCSIRANPSFELVALRDLPNSGRAMIQAAAGHHVWAVVRRRHNGELIAALDHETALLVQSFALTSSPERPSFLEQHAPIKWYQQLACLIYDSILQIEDQGCFIDGVKAHLLLNDPQPSQSTNPVHFIDKLSLQAIEYALALPLLPASILAHRLYLFNTSPRTTYWDQFTAEPGSLAVWQRMELTSTIASALNQQYIEIGPRDGQSDWLQWLRRDVERTALRHKIYISPKPSQLPSALAIVADMCCALAVPAFKVGMNVNGVLRSDKLVVYVADQQSLWMVAAELRAATAGMQAQGVPFTAPLDTDGLLTWAVDPPEKTMLRPVGQMWSWRSAVVGRLASTIASARAQECDMDDQQLLDFAFARLRMDGIESQGWLPGEEW